MSYQRGLLILLKAVFMFSGFAWAQKEIPDGYEQILPRGRIAAITKPDFVKAKDAVIAPNTWVLGVVINGKARAYSLNLLNAHEVVNDEVDGKNFAAVW